MPLTELEQLQAENAKLRGQLADLQQRLVESQKLGSVGSLASSITHEFNNILTTIINYAKMGVRHKQANIRDKAFDRILSSGQRAAKITTGLLSYVRNRSDRKDTLSLKQLVQDMLLLVEKDLQVHRIRLETRFVGEPYALISAGQMQQVLLNLIINSRQAMEPGGAVYVSVAPGSEADIVEISIRDTGCGIPADKLQKIFDPYYTTKTADAQGQGGTGIGLAFCKDVIDSHGGRIRVESVVGKGTMFTLKLPVVPSPAFAARPEVAQKAG